MRYSEKPALKKIGRKMLAPICKARSFERDYENATYQTTLERQILAQSVDEWHVACWTIIQSRNGSLSALLPLSSKQSEAVIGVFRKLILCRNLDGQFIRTGQFYSLARHSGGYTSFEWRSIFKKCCRWRTGGR